MKLGFLGVVIPAVLATMLTECVQSPLRTVPRDLGKNTPNKWDTNMTKDGKFQDTQPTQPSTTPSKKDGGGDDTEAAECNPSSGKGPSDCGKTGTAAQCGSPRPPRHGGIRHIKNGSRVRYYCHYGYWLYGPRSNKCVQGNGKHHWRNHAPKCKRSRHLSHRPRR